MKKYTIKENRPELTKAEIEQGMDFDKISSKAAGGAKIFSLKAIIITGIAATVIASLVIFWPGRAGNENLLSKEIAQLPTKINPDTFVVSTEKDTTLIYESGTQIKIPASAFVDENGNEVKGKVKINYKEFHNVSEILLSGIPMTYDSAGKQMYFESAGMFDITAQQNEKEVFIRKDKSLHVSMASLDKTEKKYNKYYLDEKTQKWEYMEKDEPVVLSNPAAGAPAKADSSKSIALKPPVKPLNERMFTIDAAGRPDLEIYNNIVFEITKDCKNFNPDEAKTEWGMVNIAKIEKSDKYKVTFSYPTSGPIRSYEVTARPLKDVNMDVAMKKYEALYSNYKQQLSEQERKELEAQEALNKEQGNYENVFKNYVALQQKNAQLYAQQVVQTAEVSQVVYRTFQIKKFGIWNSDCPQSMPQGAEVFAKFETADGERVNISAVYLVEKGKNALYNLYVPNKISFNPDAQNILLVITSKGKLGWVKNDVFEIIGKDTKNFTFRLNMLNKDTYTSSDINSIVI